VSVAEEVRALLFPAERLEVYPGLPTSRGDRNPRETALPQLRLYRELKHMSCPGGTALNMDIT
jgi:hypothetical protein